MAYSNPYIIWGNKIHQKKKTNSPGYLDNCSNDLVKIFRRYPPRLFEHLKSEEQLHFFSKITSVWGRFHTILLLMVDSDDLFPLGAAYFQW